MESLVRGKWVLRNKWVGGTPSRIRIWIMDMDIDHEKDEGECLPLYDFTNTQTLKSME